MKIDHLNGRPVVEVIRGSQDWDWQIRFVDGATIRNTDERRTTAPGNEIVGSALLESYSEDGGNNLEMVFGSVDGTTDPPTTKVAAIVRITETQYLLARPGQEAVNPSAPQPTAEDVRPPDPSPDRVQHGPEKSQETENE